MPCCLARMRQLFKASDWRRGLIIISVAMIALLPPVRVCAQAAARPRVIVTTDGEIDDRDSMIRFLLYANEF